VFILLLDDIKIINFLHDKFFRYCTYYLYRNITSSFKKKKIFAWPNIKSKRKIVPERIGNISTIKIAREVLFLIKN